MTDIPMKTDILRNILTSQENTAKFGLHRNRLDGFVTRLSSSRVGSDFRPRVAMQSCKTKPLGTPSEPNLGEDSTWDRFVIDRSV